MWTEKGEAEDEMFRLHHQFKGHECEQVPRDSEGLSPLTLRKWPHILFDGLYLRFPSPSFLSLRKSRPNAFSRLTIICVLYLQLFHLLSHIYLLKNLIPSTYLLPGSATSFANQMFISFTNNGQTYLDLHHLKNNQNFSLFLPTFNLLFHILIPL